MFKILYDERGMIRGYTTIPQEAQNACYMVDCDGGDCRSCPLSKLPLSTYIDSDIRKILRAEIEKNK